MLGSILLAQAISLLFGYSPSQFVITGHFTFTSGIFPVWFLLIIAPIFEELGWHSYGTDCLRNRMNLFTASLLFGVFWGIWHLPAFFLSGTVYGSWDFFPFFVGNITLAILVTPIFNGTRGGLFWPAMFHWQLINPFWPDAQPYDTWIFVGLTAVIVWWNRDNMFSRVPRG